MRPATTPLGPVPFGLAALAEGQPAAADALALAQMVREAVAAEVPRQALHLRLSRLAPRLRRGHHRRLLREALEPALRPVRSRLFELPNGDLVAVTPPGGRHLREAEAVLAILLGEEAAEAPLHAVLDLPRDAAALLAAVEDSLGPPPAPRPRPAPGAGFGPGDLAALEAALRGAGLARFLRRHPVCRLERGGEGPALEWDEWRLAWPELRAETAPALDPGAAPWLARRLRRLLDRRLLAELSRPEEARRRGPLGLVLSAASLAEAEFLRLDALLDVATRAATVLALPAEDALAAPEDFAFARDFARARGYRLALDLPGPELLAACPPDRMGVDLLRLPWSPDLAALGPALPQGRVVLTGADRAAAIGWGWEAGVALFEGRLLRPR
ncbi:hypothetical protein E2C06_14050 [Dankookia rubra]|uniref:EAL domain-containing protein n=1 Tax=Dankookia rubra TaxID=1442381 RepID=A0A4R5QFQ9_9PROT|nr:hypothetical protein [Dankookia rubra]TDH62080.1 hypothetical protein E2C06_14050 [Dankookia rubra]